ncbi:hypothetical protein LOTGIDRAFT_97454, partial [Lottia gigantea]
KKQVLDMNGWLAIQWTDTRYAWDPASYGNISTVSLPCHDFVKPDVKLYNSAHDGVVVQGEFNCVVSSNGLVTYIPQVSIHSHCPIQNPTSDEFTCHLKFGSWAHPCKDLSINKDESKLDVSVFKSNWRFEIIDHSSEVISKKYDCCPDIYCSVDMELK